MVNIIILLFYIQSQDVELNFTIQGHFLLGVNPQISNIMLTGKWKFLFGMQCTVLQKTYAHTLLPYKAYIKSHVIPPLRCLSCSV